MKKFNIIICALSLVLLASCSLDYYPEGQLTTSNPLSSTSELRLYMNQFYEGTFGDGNDDESDDMCNTTVPTTINGAKTVSQASKVNEYNKIYAINWFLENVGNCKGDAKEIMQYTGEAYFFRAYVYFQMVRKWGDITWINKVMPTDQDAMKIPRDSRLMVIDSILANLDKAAAYVPTYNGNTAGMRIHKDFVLAFKSRVALYEGTWQRYHKADNDPFYSKEVTDEKINDYLTQARDAAKAVIDGGRWGVYSKGNPEKDYQDLFITKDLSNNNEAMFWKKFDKDVTPAVSHTAAWYMYKGGGPSGMTRSFIDDFLTRDGRIFTGEERLEAKKVWGKELEPSLRDPRLAQTVATPGTRMSAEGTEYTYMAPYPQLINDLTPAVETPSPSGYPQLKGLEYWIAHTSPYLSEAPSIFMRYPEVLLNYAEALAELEGDGAQAEIARVIKPLRDRVGMPAVDFAREYNTDPEYPFHYLSATIQVVRRERRCEFGAEGKRHDDIFRWSAGDDVLAGKIFEGALFVGSDLEAQNVKDGFYKGRITYDQEKKNSHYMTGNPGDPYRYISVYADEAPNGLGFDVNRDYLEPIHLDEINLTEGAWVQNPGW